LGGCIHTIQKNTEASIVASKEIGVEVNAENTKYIITALYQNAGQNHNIKKDNKFSERLKLFRYFGTTLTNQNCILEEIKSSLKSGNACCHWVQNILSLICYLKIQRLRYTVLFAGCYVLL
jgi:hypothetical protein